MRRGSIRLFVSIILSLLLTFQSGLLPAQEHTQIEEFTKALAFKGPIIGGTQAPLSSEDFLGGSPLMYPSQTRYVNWEFSFTYHNYNQTFKTKILAQIIKDGKKIGESFDEIIFEKGSKVMDYFGEFGSSTERIWTKGLYKIIWSIEGTVFAEEEITILEEELTRSEVIESLRNDFLEIYFLETAESRRDYSYANNYRFPKERVGLLAFRITFRFPHHIDAYNLKAKVRIWPLGIEHMDKIIDFDFNSSDFYIELSNKTRWSKIKNWPAGNYRLEVSVEDKAIVFKDFSIF